jgi:hypothetical protein
MSLLIDNELWVVPNYPRAHKETEMPIGEEFTEVKETAVADARGRITLGPGLAKQKFKVSINANGEVLLTPVVTISVPPNEAWLHKNPTALRAVRQGMDDAEHGRVYDLGSFAEYAELDVDE